ncbi:MAG: ATP-binding protein [Thiogranum sp.]
MPSTLFPLDVATGHAFCNRTEERAHLFGNIQSQTHTLISAPRRYGKTSLVAQVLEDLKRKKQPVVCVHIDLLLAGTPESAQRYLLDAVAKGLAELLPVGRHTLQKISSMLNSLKTKAAVSSSGISLEIEPQDKPEKGIADALIALDNLAGKEKKAVVVFMDEFQQLGELANNAVLEAAIRHAAQYARHTSYIFTGSNRHLLGMMFDDSARPLYHMCDRIVLRRIADVEYHKFIQRAAKKRWGRPFEIPILEAVLNKTSRHPYYLNVLCGQLWKQTGPISLQDVAALWDGYVASERHRVSKEINSLSNYQRELLTRLALHPTTHPRSHEYLAGTTIKSGSVSQLIERLMTQDFVYIDEKGVYRLVDPVIDATIRGIFSNKKPGVTPL